MKPLNMAIVGAAILAAVPAWQNRAPHPRARQATLLLRT